MGQFSEDGEREQPTANLASCDWSQSSYDNIQTLSCGGVPVGSIMSLSRELW